MPQMVCIRMCVFNAFKVTTAVRCAANLTLISLCQRNLKKVINSIEQKNECKRSKKERKGKMDTIYETAGIEDESIAQG